MSFVYGRMQSCHLHTAFFYSVAKVRIVLKIYNGLELISLFSEMLIFLTRIYRTISNGLNLSVSLSYKAPLSFILVHILYHIPHFIAAENMSFLKKMMKYPKILNKAVGQFDCFWDKFLMFCKNCFDDIEKISQILRKKEKAPD